jgi:mRNA-degrading endonuclease RelE of RelBE toxin-antitoxin system
VRKYRPRYTPEAAARIRKLHPQIKADIRFGIRALIESPLLGHPLHFDLAGYCSYRVRTYRIIYRVNDDAATVDIVFVGARRTVYEELQALLRDQLRRN